MSVQLSWNQEVMQCNFFGCPNKGDLIKFVSQDGREFFFCAECYDKLHLKEAKRP